MYLDHDGDSYGDICFVNACVQPSSYVSDSTDCNDFDAGISPDGTEVCDGVDNDCDGTG